MYYNYPSPDNRRHPRSTISSPPPAVNLTDTSSLTGTLPEITSHPVHVTFTRRDSGSPTVKITLAIVIPVLILASLLVYFFLPWRRMKCSCRRGDRYAREFPKRSSRRMDNSQRGSLPWRLDDVRRDLTREGLPVLDSDPRGGGSLLHEVISQWPDPESARSAVPLDPDGMTKKSSSTSGQASIHHISLPSSQGSPKPPSIHSPSPPLPQTQSARIPNPIITTTTPHPLRPPLSTITTTHNRQNSLTIHSYSAPTLPHPLSIPPRRSSSTSAKNHRHHFSNPPTFSSSYYSAYNDFGARLAPKQPTSPKGTIASTHSTDTSVLSQRSFGALSSILSADLFYRNGEGGGVRGRDSVAEANDDDDDEDEDGESEGKYVMDVPVFEDAADDRTPTRHDTDFRPRSRSNTARI